MNISKISRSLVVVVFVALIVFLGISDFIYIRSSEELQSISSFTKFGYFVLIIVLVSLYTYVREKLSKRKLKKSIATVYKYSYMTLIMLAATFFKVYNSMSLYPTRTLILYFVLTYLIGLFTQRIIFNISKSEVLSVFGMFIAYTLPNVVIDKTMNLNAKFIAVVLLLSIYVMQILIDELKQINIKNKKYIKEAIALGVCVGIGTILGVNYILWEVVALISLFITSNLDTTSLNLTNKKGKKKQTNTIKRKRNNYFIYKVERIRISKLLIALVIVVTIASGIYFAGRTGIRSLANRGNGVCQNIVNDITVGVKSSELISFANIKAQSEAFCSTSTRFYIVCFVYILAMELLSVVLHRKYDTKSTLIKLIFVAIYAIITIFKLNILYYQPMLTMLIIIISIADTTNIYYNREERIKMIEA